MAERKNIFKGRLLTLYTEKRRLPNGYKARLEIIKHPGAALIVPFLSKDKVVMLRQYRPVINSYIYELPAGTLGKNEKPSLCAGREIIEETGYSAGKITRIGYIYPAPGYTTEKIIIFKAERLKHVGFRAEENEIIDCLTLDKKKVRALFKKGKIVDAKTISALAMCGWI